MTLNPAPEAPNHCSLGGTWKYFHFSACYNPKARWTPPPCNSGIIGIQEDPNIVTSIPYSRYYRVGGPPNRKEQHNSYCLLGFRVPHRLVAHDLKPV